MSHRVIAGQAKGTRLKMVPGEHTRPIMDRAKEALFNIIGTDIYDTLWLDLFAGTGSVAIEALSRGASHATLNELEQTAIQTINTNLSATRLTQQADVIRGDAFRLLKRKPRHPFNYVYIAPPQYHGLWEQALRAIDDNPAWHIEGMRVIVQIDPKEQHQVELKHLTATDERRYGNTLLWFFEVDIHHAEDIDMSHLESVIDELIETFNIQAPRVVVEQMLQFPKEDMCQAVDITQITDGIRLNPKDGVFGVRASTARFFARNLVESAWGKAHGIDQMTSDEDIAQLGRMIMLPRKLILRIDEKFRTVSEISREFEAPESDVTIRLTQLGM